jgi:hypothetical protein
LARCAVARASSGDTERAIVHAADRLTDDTATVKRAWPTAADLVAAAGGAIEHRRHRRIARERYAEAEPRLQGRDLIHADLDPGNILVSDGRLTAIVDWHGCREGDAAFDLAGLAWGLHSAAPATRAVDERSLENHPEEVVAFVAPSTRCGTLLGPSAPMKNDLLSSKPLRSRGDHGEALARPH